MKPKFDFKELDSEGMENLEAISEAGNFNRWMYEQIRPHCKGNILEIGSGIGNISHFLLEDDQHAFLSDIRESYRKVLQEQFGDKKNLGGVLDLDIVDRDFDQKYASMLGTFDTVFALNVVEHIEDDMLAIKNCHKLLKKGGRLIILVPAYQSLYNTFDKELHHYRRYNSKKLNGLFTANHFEILDSRYFNALGIAGWYVSGKLQRNRTIPGGQMKLYNMITPIARLMDTLLLKRVGLSVITVGRK